MIRWFMLCCCIATFAVSPCWALQTQSTQQPPPDPPVTSKPKDQNKADKPSDWPRSPEALEYEVQYKAAVAQRQAERRKAVEAAEQIVTLARPLTRADAIHAQTNIKANLEKITKLAKRIRAFSGGDDADHTLEAPPQTVSEGAARIVALAENLKRGLEKFDHRVISVTIINDSNMIILLSEYLRQQARQP
ncbi:MAG: hypothetical protein RMM98_16520 [Acidobacteriota bacterium]|nr:hypothetical protein [Blastocatellia bacterium]MDW8241207.1 hypothetical protein [Acidobacteriota bacterium]